MVPKETKDFKRKGTLDPEKTIMIHVVGRPYHPELLSPFDLGTFDFSKSISVIEVKRKIQRQFFIPVSRQKLYNLCGDELPETYIVSSNQEDVSLQLAILKVLSHNVDRKRYQRSEAIPRKIKLDFLIIQGPLKEQVLSYPNANTNTKIGEVTTFLLNFHAQKFPRRFFKLQFFLENFGAYTCELDGIKFTDDLDETFIFDDYFVDYLSFDKVIPVKVVELHQHVLSIEFENKTHVFQVEPSFLTVPELRMMLLNEDEEFINHLPKLFYFRFTDTPGKVSIEFSSDSTSIKICDYPYSLDESFEVEFKPLRPVVSIGNNIELKPSDTKEDVETKLETQYGIVDDFRFFLNHTILKPGVPLILYNLNPKSVLHQVRRFRGELTREFRLPTNLKRLEQSWWTCSTFPWREYIPGLLFEGICMNSSCRAFDKWVIDQSHSRKMYPNSIYACNLTTTDELVFHCPICNFKGNVGKLGFHKCCFRILGQKADLEDEIVVVKDWTQVLDEYVTWNDLFPFSSTDQHPHIHEEWSNLQVFIRDARYDDDDPSNYQKCLVCENEEHRFDNLVQLTCQHKFHRDCLLKKWMKDSIAYCPVCRNPIEFRNVL